MQKREIYINFDIHAFSEGKLHDWYLDDAPYYGIQGPLVMEPLARMRNRKVLLKYDDSNTLADILEWIKDEIWGQSEVRDFSCVKYGFTVNDERYYIDRQDANFSFLLSKYLDPRNTGYLIATILVSCDAGTIDEDDKLKYFMHSREQGRHNFPHVHVEDYGHKYSATINILTGEAIESTLPARLAKKARDRIIKNQEYFIFCWNTKTDGLRIDLEHHFGDIP